MIRVVLSLWLLLGAGGPAFAQSVVVTLPPLAGMVRMIDSGAAPRCLLGRSADPHAMRITPRQADLLRTAPLLVRSSGDDGGWAGLRARALASLDLWPGHRHAWLLPSVVAARLPALAEALEQRGLFPEGRGAALVERAQQRLYALDRRWREMLRPLGTRGVIMQHPAWQALLEHYGVPVRAVLEGSEHGHAATPRRLSHALRLLKGDAPPLLIVETSHGNRMIDWLRARVPSARVVRLDALGDCSESLDALIARNQQRWAEAVAGHE